MESVALTGTRRSLHGIAELVLAGPQYRAVGDIKLRVTGNGFGTVDAPELRVDGDRLVSGEARLPLDGGTYRELAAAAGVVAGAPEGVYPTGAGVGPDDPITLDPEATRLIIEGFVHGDAALRRFAPQEEPVLWPEHFDVAITVDEVNYGVSPGDSYLPEPYAYVGPHRPRQGSFWNAPFGAARPLRSLPDEDQILTFFHEGKLR